MYIYPHPRRQDFPRWKKAQKRTGAYVYIYIYMYHNIHIYINICVYVYRYV